MALVRLIESETGRFIHRREMPKDRQASYYNPQCKIKIKPDGTIQRCVRGTFGGDKVHYPGDSANLVLYLLATPATSTFFMPSETLRGVQTAERKA